jgi:protein O-mannosyl-transferase
MTQTSDPPSVDHPLLEGRPGAAERRARWIVVTAVMAAYATSFGGRFVFDDWMVVVRDPRVQSLGAWWHSMPGIRPLLKLSYAVNHASGLGLAGFHAVNLALHLVNALLVYALLHRLERRAVPEGGAPGALFGALLFALHPAQTEAVTYVSGRSTALVTTLLLASVLTWMEGRENGRWWLAGLVSPFLFAAALGAKEVAFALPAALLLLEALDRRRLFSWRAAGRAVAGHALVLAMSAGAFLLVPAYRRMVVASLHLREPLQNLLVQIHALVWLAGQALRPDRLSADPGVEGMRAFGLEAVLGGLAIAAALGGGLWLLRRRPAFSWSLLWPLIWLAPASWILPRAEAANDRQLYLALAGPAWLAGRGLAWCHARGGVRRASTLALLVALAVGTALRNTAYFDEIRFWEDVTRKSPENARAHNNLGYALAAACRLEEAQEELARALDRDPTYVRAAVNLKLLREGAPLGPGQPRCR